MPFAPHILSDLSAQSENNKNKTDDALFANHNHAHFSRAVLMINDNSRLRVGKATSSKQSAHLHHVVDPVLVFKIRPSRIMLEHVGRGRVR